MVTMGRYTGEFRRSAVNLVLVEGLTTRKVTERLGIPGNSRDSRGPRRAGLSTGDAFHMGRRAGSVIRFTRAQSRQAFLAALSRPRPALMTSDLPRLDFDHGSGATAGCAVAFQFRKDWSANP